MDGKALLSIILKDFYLCGLTVDIWKLVNEKAVPSFKPRKGQRTKISFSDYIYFLIQFWLTVGLFIGVKSELECEFESFGSQKVNF